MNKDNIIRIAREVWGDTSNKPWSDSALLHLERFAALVAAAEREAICEIANDLLDAFYSLPLIDAIRARENK